jgi:hypothetical protein
VQKSGSTLAVLFVAAGLFVGSPQTQTAPPSAPVRDLTLLVPRAAEIPGWSARGDAQRFSGDDLYVYIDGGAELYNEYGFKQVLAQDFVNKDQKGVTLEIYEMADPAAAFGIFSFKASGKGRPLGIGTDSEFEDYYLHFWKGPFLVTVTGFEANPDCRDGVTAIARATGARIREAAGRPAFLSRLPAEWIKPGLKYIRGALGLYNLHPFFARDMLRFQEAVAVPIEDGLVFVFGYPSAAEALVRLTETRQAIAADPAYRNVHEFSDGHFEAVDSKGNALYARAKGSVLGLVLSPRAAVIGGDLLKRLRS